MSGSQNPRRVHISYPHSAPSALSVLLSFSPRAENFVHLRRGGQSTKREEERVFYEEQLRSSERQFSELESRMREYEELVVDNRNNMGKNQEEVEPESLSEEDKLSTIEETGSLEVG